MGHPRLVISRLPVFLAATLVAACTGPTEEPLAEATLAFTMDSSIYLITTAEAATPSLIASGFIQPSWRPDGRVLAVVSTYPYPRAPGFPADQSLYLAIADGGGVSDLSGFDWPIIGHALWAPDATSLLFMRARTMPSSAWVVRMSEGGVTENSFGVAFGVPPSWSHDGALVALDNGEIISLIDPWTGDTIVRVTGAWPQFSPVNDELAFREPATGHIHLIRSDSTAERDLQVEGYPQSWSPDGKRVAFVGSDGIYTINSDGSHLTRIGPLNVEVSDLAWSVDGRRIAYVTRGSSGPRALYVARADDSDARSVVQAAELCCLSWRP